MTLCNNEKNHCLKRLTEAIYKILPGLTIASDAPFCNINQHKSESNVVVVQQYPATFMHTDMRIRLCAPQDLSLYSISKRRLNPPLVPVCVLSMWAPNGPEGAATQPKMSINYKVCELDFISQPNTSYFTTQYLSVCHVCLAGGKLKAIWVALTASWGIMFWHGSWGKSQGCLLSPFPFTLLKSASFRVIVSGPVKDFSKCVIDKES